MLRILRLPAVAKPIVWVILFSLLNIIHGCYYFKVTGYSGPEQSAIVRMQDEKKFVILHMDEKVWHFTNISVSEEKVNGIITDLIGHQKYLTVRHDAANRYKSMDKQSESSVLNEIHIFVNAFSKTNSGQISIPLSAIEKIEIYDKDTGATVASWVFSTLGVVLGAFGVFLLILALTKSSCPFIYAYDGTDYVFSGEIFSGATQPGLERDDYLPLNKIAPSEGVYKLKMRNEVHEIQSVDLAELIVVDHPKGISVIIDKYGVPHFIERPLQPFEVKNHSGTDILPLICAKDSLFYSGDGKNNEKKGIEEIVMKFVRPAAGGSAKLILRAKNSFWLDVLFTKFHEMFGERYNVFTKRQESTSGEKLNKFLLDQNIPLSISIEKNGEWQFADYFNIAGPMALRDDILSLNLSGINSDTIKIKMETGFLFWDIDYAAMDFSKDENIAASSIAIKSALDQNGIEVKDLLLSTDKNYLVLKEVGNESSLVFNTPPQKTSERTLFLHTRGYYKILREQKGTPDKKALKTFRKPNRFPAFSKETYDQLPEKNRSLEKK